MRGCLLGAGRRYSEAMRLPPARLLPSLAAAAIVAALVAVVTGCGVTGTIDPVASAATKSENAGTAHVTFEASVTSPDSAADAFTMRGSGTMSQDAAALTVDVPALDKATGKDASMKEIFLTQNGDYVIFLQLGALAGQLPAGKTWMEIDLSKAGKQMGIDFDKLMGSQTSQNPAQMLDMLRSTSGKVDDLGTETIDGDSTTHYHAVVDLAEAIKAKGGVSAQAAQQLLRESGDGRVPVDVWVDADGLIRRFRMTYSQTLSGHTSQVAMTFGMSDYGSAPEITAPSADEVFDATDLAVQGYQQQQSTTTTP